MKYCLVPIINAVEADLRSVVKCTIRRDRRGQRRNWLTLDGLLRCIIYDGMPATEKLSEFVVNYGIQDSLQAVLELMQDGTEMYDWDSLKLLQELYMKIVKIHCSDNKFISDVLNTPTDKWETLVNMEE